MQNETLYELKLSITPAQRDTLVRSLKLVFEKEFTDNDQYLQTEPGDPREKVKVRDSSIQHSRISFEKGLFTIVSEGIDKEKMRNLLTRGVTSEKRRKKEQYDWPGRDVKVTFDYITEAGPRLFLEVYGRRRADVEQAKKVLAEKGYTGTVTLTYDELTGSDTT